MGHCVVLGCICKNNKKCNKKRLKRKLSNKITENIRFFRFPKDEELCKLWIQACGNPKVNPRNARICSLHFTDQDYLLKDQLMNTANKRLKLDAVPTQSVAKPEKRTQRAAIQARKELVRTALEEYEKNVIAEKDQIPNTSIIPKTEPIDTTDNFETIFIPETVKEEPIKVEPQDSNQTDQETPRKIFLLQIIPEQSKAATRILALEKELKDAKVENSNLKMRMSKANILYTSLKQSLTDGQIKKLENPEKRIVWSNADISSAYCLYTAGPGAYRHLCKKNFPLPAVNILKRWAAKANVTAGMLKSILNDMESSSYDKNQRLCVLCFDEMKFSSGKKTDAGETASDQPKYAELIMVRGLLEQWDHPVYYEYDKRLSLALLSDVIKELENINYTVVAIVADMRITHQQLWKDLGINSTDPWIPNPAKNEHKIFIFADTLHLARALRAHFVYSGFKINEKIISVAPLQELNRPNLLQDLGITYKTANNELVYVKNLRRQDFNHAISLFSTTLTTQIRDLMQENNIQNENITECCAFLHTIAEWLGIFRSSISSSETDERKMAYGRALNTQLMILENMDNLMKDIRANNKLQKDYEYPFQKGVRKCNAALPQFYDYMRTMYGIDAIPTSNLSQDVLSKFMQTKLQAKGNRYYDAISPDEFKYGLESYCVGGM